MARSGDARAASRVYVRFVEAQPQDEEDTMANIQRKSLDQPDETRPVDKGVVEVVAVGDTTMMRATLEPGWQWSECVKPVVGGDSC